MRYLKGLEEETAQHWIKLAAEETKNSRCSKSNRGVVIVKDDITLLGKGTNNPPGKVECLTERCYEICNEYAVHAEQNAIIEALRNGKNIEGTRMYHVKVKNDEIKYSGGPSCVQCSKLVLETGIKNFVLKHRGGYGLYEAEEFHELSLQTLEAKKSIVIPRPVRVITGDQHLVEPEIDKLFDNVIKYLERKENLEKGNGLHPYFDRDTRLLARQNSVITDEMLHTLKFRDDVVASVIETRDGYNRVRYTFYANLDHL